MEGLFTKIINGKIPSYKIAEDENYYAFLDINPLAKGHTLVIPKVEVDYIFDLDNDTLAGLHLFSKRVAQALESTIECKRVGVLVIGTEVPHAHIHLIPFQKESQMAITGKKLSFEADEMKEIAENASKAYELRNVENGTLVFGASLKGERYSNKAIKMLVSHDHNVLAIGGRKGEVDGISILTGQPDLSAVDTITMYMGEERQKDHEDYLLSLRPRRIIFNPGAENRGFAQKAREKGVIIEEACTLVMLRTGQY
ncbi:MAG: histidine triad (HIT) family protein [Halioglobus sp.]|jgi:histidine triad (HIT) family protein